MTAFPFRITLIRVAASNGSAWLPAALLATAMAVVFALNADRAHYYAPMEWDTVKNAAVAENLSPRHNFAMFISQSFGNDGEPTYEVYSRFPIGGYALLKLAMLPFGENMAAKIFAARLLMLAFLAGAAFLAYRAIARIACNNWIALTAALIAFSSYYVLRYGNQVSNEFMMDLFATMLTFHGMVLFIQDGRFRQLLIKTSAALLIGWHVYAFLLPFIALGLGGELIAAARSSPKSNRLGFAAPIIARSRYVRLGAAALLFGAAMLAFNFGSEYYALKGETPISELPSVRSVFKKLGGEQEFIADDGLAAWGAFLHQQSYRVGAASFPYALTQWPGPLWEPSADARTLALAAAGWLAVGSCFIGLLFVRRERILLWTLALSGLCWTLLTPNEVSYPAHDHQAIYYIGLPITIAALLLLAAERRGWPRPVFPVAAGLALALFCVSAWQMMALDADERLIQRREAAFSDLANIRDIVQEKNVLVAHSIADGSSLYGSHAALRFFLSGSRVRHADDDLPPPPHTDFVLIPHYRDEASPLITPENKMLFLYERIAPADVKRSWLNSVASSGEPAARSVYDLHIRAGALVYLKENCAPADAERRFFLHVIPEQASDLPAWRKSRGFDNLDFPFEWWDASVGGVCAARVPLPRYPIAGLRTGQFIRGEGATWEAVIRLSP